ncbi:MAG: hypothetical protein JJP05_04520 [cyanobacterium endosymbiont of Rhopalodia gibba]
MSNAAIHMPLLKKLLRSPKGYELAMITNHLEDVRLSQALTIFGTQTSYFKTLYPQPR